jgi:ribosomal protein S18 acetylase RimI-like enzyme
MRGEDAMLKFRPAEIEDISKLAVLIAIASDGIAEYLFHDLVPGMRPVQVVAYSLENDHDLHLYKSVIVAVDNDDIVGMALSYASSLHKITDEMRSFFPPDRLAHFRHFYASRIENSWFLDALCVVESHRRRGIGEKLISLTKQRAAENGCTILSLLVFADNAAAIALYRRAGFETVQKVDLRANEFIKHQDGCLLMRCDITT